MAELGTVYVDVEGDFNKFKKQSKKGFSAIGKVAAGAFAAAFVGKQIFDFGAKTIKAAEEYGSLVAGASNLIAQQQKALGDEATLTTQHIVDQADSIQKLTGFSNEHILAAQRQLLTFQGIQNEGEGASAVFDRTTEALADMVASGALSDFNSGAILMGKALNDPLTGMTALSRSGVVFTDQQKEVVKALVEGGDTLGAQKVILDELEKVYGGTAASQRDATAVISNAWNDVQVKIGEQLLPLLEKFALWFVDVAIPTLQEWWPVIVETGDTIMAVFEAAWKIVEPIFEAFGKAIQTVRDIFKRDGDAIGQQFEDTGSWLKETWDQIVVIFKAASELVTVIIEAAIAYYKWIWENFGEEIMIVIGFIWRTIQTIIDTALGVINGILETFIGLFTGDWQRMWDGIKGIFTSVWDGLMSLLGDYIATVGELMVSLGPKILGWLGDFGSLLLDVGKDLITGLINGIKSSAGRLVAAIKNFVIDKIPGPIKSFFGLNSPSKFMMQYGQWISEGMAIGIGDGAKGVERAVDSLLVGPSASLNGSIETGGMMPAFGVTNNFNAPVGGSMGSFARDIAYEGAKELRYAYG